MSDPATPRLTLMMSAEVVISSRYHNLICALRLARPTIAISYAGKCRDLMETLGLGDYCQDIDHLDADRLLDQLRTARQSGPELTELIRLGTSHYAAEVESLLRRVSGELLGLEDRRSPELVPCAGEVGLCQPG